MRVLGLDLGDKTVGVAVSDPLGLIAQGIGVIARAGEDQDLEKIKAIADQYAARLIVIGLPWNMSGTLGEQGKKVLAFAKKLEKATGLPVQTWDERLTTAAAEKALLSADLTRARRKKVIDKVAAALILQNFLDAKRTTLIGNNRQE